MNVNLPQASAQGSFATINGIQTYYEVYGKGAPLLLLHGFTDSALSWQPYIGGLAEHFQVIVPELRGHGRTLDPMRQYTIAQVAADAFALLDHLGIAQFKAIGDSAGGCGLQYMACQQPERIDAIIIESAGAYFPEQTRAMLLADVDTQVTESHPQLHHHLHGVSQIQALEDQLPKIVESYNAQPPDLSKITAKTLIVMGDRDELYPIELAVEMYKSIAHAYLWIVPNAGHSFIYVDPEKYAPTFVRAALSFFQGKW